MTHVSDHTTALDAVLEALEKGREMNAWLTPYEIQMHVAARYGNKYSDSCITARLRDLRKAQYGGRKVDCRKRDTSHLGYISRAYEYRLEGEA